MLTIKQIFFIFLATFGWMNASFAQTDAALAARIIGNASQGELGSAPIVDPQNPEQLLAKIRQERLALVRRALEDPSFLSSNRRTEGNATVVPEIERDAQRRFGSAQQGQIRFGGSARQNWAIVRQGEQNYLACFHGSLAVIEVPEARAPQNLKRPGRSYYAQICAGQQFPARENRRYQENQSLISPSSLASQPVTHSVIQWITIDDPRQWEGACSSVAGIEDRFKKAFPSEDTRRMTEQAKRDWHVRLLAACSSRDYVVQGFNTSGYSVIAADDDFRQLVDRKLGDRVRFGDPSEDPAAQEDPCSPDNAFGPVGGCARGAGGTGTWRQYDPNGRDRMQMPPGHFGPGMRPMPGVQGGFRQPYGPYGNGNPIRPGY